MVERVFWAFGRQRGARTRIAVLALATLPVLVFTPPAAAVFAAPYGVEETLITVTTDSDASNGAVATVEDLLADPGPDGISLREAIEATNNDPGRYAIRFAPALRGATIRVGSAPPGEQLPGLAGGGVSIDGDIDGDGDPDITLVDETRVAMHCMPDSCGFAIASSGNRLSSIALRGFDYGIVHFPLPPSSEAYRGNVIAGLVMAKIRLAGISAWAYPETHISLIDTQFIGNTIEAGAGGIGIQLLGSGDRVERLTIAGNTIRVLSRRRYRGGIGLTAGFDSRQNRISDVLIEDNSISGNPEMAIAVASYGVATENVIERVRIIDNRIDLSTKVPSRLDGIFLTTGDGHWLHPPPAGNTMEDVEISGNTVTIDGREGRREGRPPSTGQGIYVFAGLGGAAHNRIRGIRIERNTIRLISADVVAISIYGSHGGPSIQSERNEVSDVSIASNRITIVPDRTVIEFVGVHVGGIMVEGGQGSRASVHDVRITDNRVDTPLIGIYLLGGAGGPKAWGTKFPAVGNALFDVEVRGNHVVRAPVDAFLRYVPFHADLRARGITIVGGIGQARGNTVSCVRLANNRVAGPRGVTVVANVGGASRNTAALGGC